MRINSSYFGEITIPEDKVIMFESPIPGFENDNKYFIVTDDDERYQGSEDNRLFCWLHSADNGDVAFALLDVFKIKDDYQPEIEEKYLQELNYKDGDNIAVYNIVNIPEKITDMTVNLLAPLVINFSKMKGMQIVLGNGEYSLRHKIFEDIQKINENAKGVK